MVSFRADWNPLDESMAQVVSDVEAAVGDQVAVALVDVSADENQELIRHLGLTHLPALLFVFRNRVVDYRVGFSKVRFVAHVQQLMQAFSPYAQETPAPWHPGPYPSGIVLPPPVVDASGVPGQPAGLSRMSATPPGGMPRFTPGLGQGGRPAFGLIPYQLPLETEKKTWWEKLLGK